MRGRISFAVGVFALVSLPLAVPVAAQGDDIPRTSAGRPALSGTYDVSTLTPMQRPRDYGETMALTAEQAAELSPTVRYLTGFGSRGLRRG